MLVQPVDDLRVAVGVVGRSDCAASPTSRRGIRRADRRSGDDGHAAGGRADHLGRAPPAQPAWSRSPGAAPAGACRCRGGSRRRRDTPSRRPCGTRTPEPCPKGTPIAGFCAPFVHLSDRLATSGDLPARLMNVPARCRARGGVRTHMTRRSGGFKPPVSANSTTRAGERTQAIHLGDVVMPESAGRGHEIGGVT